MESNRERLGHGCRVVAQRVRHAAADGRRRGDELGQATVHVKAEGPVARAEVGAAAPAPIAVPARDPGAGDDAVTDADAVGTVTGCYDTPNELVSEDDGRLRKQRPVRPLRR